MNSRNSRRAWSRRSWPSRSRVRSTSEEIENPISPPNTTAYSVVRLCSPTMWLLKRCAVISAVSRIGAALPSPTTVSRFFIVRSLRSPTPIRKGRHVRRYHNHAIFLKALTARRSRDARLHSLAPRQEREGAGMRVLLCVLYVIAGWAPAGHAAAQTVSFGTDWKAEAEHGGYYQAIATGIYQGHGLEVTLRQGGPQVNHAQLLAAGRLDFNLAPNSFGPLNFASQNIPMVAVAAIFQKDPSVLIAHPGQGNDSLAALQGKPIMIGSDTRVTSWMFLKSKFGYTDDQIRPYAFSVAPFLADPKAVQQGYLSSEPFTIEAQGMKPVVLLLADAGYSSYGSLIQTSEKLVRTKPDLVQRFVDASIEGWYSYLYGDPA